MLVFACKPEDFVVVKLDIDTPAIEQTIIAVLAQLGPTSPRSSTSCSSSTTSTTTA